MKAKENIVIFLDIDGVIATKNSLDNLWGSIVNYVDSYDSYFEYFQKELQGYKRPLCSMYYYPFDVHAIKNYHALQYFIYKILGYIPVTVLSSTWRYHFDNMFECREEMAKRGLQLLYLQGSTIRGMTRGHEIQEYVDRFNIDKYIVIDDDCSYDIVQVIDKSKCIETTFKHGFDIDKYTEAIEALYLQLNTTT